MNTNIPLNNILFANLKKVKEWEVEDIRDENNKKFFFETPLMYIPFGVEKDYNNYIIKLQFKGMKKENNQEMESFHSLIKSFEDKIIETKNIDKDIFKSQIIQKENYDDLLVIKINKKFCNIDITNQNSELRNIFNIEKKSEIKCKLHIDNLWTNNKTMISKFIVDKIIIHET